MWDVQFWLLLIPSVISAWYQYQAVKLTRRHERASATSKTVRSNAGSASGVVGRLGFGLPTLVFVLSLVNWVPYIQSRIEMVTPSNVETHLRSWLDAFQLGVQEVSNPESHFTYIVSLNNGTKLFIERSKSHDRYLSLTAHLVPNQSTKEIIAKLTQDQKHHLKEELRLYLSSSRVAFVIADQLSDVLITSSVPITPTLDEYTVIDRINNMDFAVTGAEATMRKHLPVAVGK
jgi:hypothetical protein